jgi:hypothetical protein
MFDGCQELTAQDRHQIVKATALDLLPGIARRVALI